MEKLNVNQNMDSILMVGDRVLIKPQKSQKRTQAGLYLPPGVKEKESVHTGYVIKTGPGYPIPAIASEDEPWKETTETVKYIPLQPKTGDLAVYLHKNGYDIEFNNEKYIIIPQHAILMLIRDENLFD